MSLLKSLLAVCNKLWQGTIHVKLMQFLIYLSKLQLRPLFTVNVLWKLMHLWEGMQVLPHILSLISSYRLFTELKHYTFSCHIRASSISYSHVYLLTREPSKTRKASFQAYKHIAKLQDTFLTGASVGMAMFTFPDWKSEGQGFAFMMKVSTTWLKHVNSFAHTILVWGRQR